MFSLRRPAKLIGASGVCLVTLGLPHGGWSRLGQHDDETVCSLYMASRWRSDSAPHLLGTTVSQIMEGSEEAYVLRVNEYHAVRPDAVTGAVAAGDSEIVLVPWHWSPSCQPVPWNSGRSDFVWPYERDSQRWVRDGQEVFLLLDTTRSPAAWVRDSPTFDVYYAYYEVSPAGYLGHSGFRMGRAALSPVLYHELYHALPTIEENDSNALGALRHLESWLRKHPDVRVTDYPVDYLMDALDEDIRAGLVRRILGLASEEERPSLTPGFWASDLDSVTNALTEQYPCVESPIPLQAEPEDVPATITCAIVLAGQAALEHSVRRPRQALEASAPIKSVRVYNVLADLDGPGERWAWAAEFDLGPGSTLPFVVIDRGTGVIVVDSVYRSMRYPG